MLFDLLLARAAAKAADVLRSLDGLEWTSSELVCLLHGRRFQARRLSKKELAIIRKMLPAKYSNNYAKLLYEKFGGHGMPYVEGYVLLDGEVHMCAWNEFMGVTVLAHKGKVLLNEGELLGVVTTPGDGLGLTKYDTVYGAPLPRKVISEI